MLGTTRVREPSGRVRSIAMPRLTCSGVTSTGLPFSTAYELFISGCWASARTNAYPIKWVKLTLPPRPRARWLLITIRLSAISFAGTARTQVAVGTASDASMFATMRAATPRIGLVVAWAGAGVGFAPSAFCASTGAATAALPSTASTRPATGVGGAALGGAAVTAGAAAGDDDEATPAAVAEGAPDAVRVAVVVPPEASAAGR